MHKSAPDVSFSPRSNEITVDWPCVESFSTGKTMDGKIYENDYCWVFEVSNGKIDAMREYMDSHYTAKLFGMS